MIVDNKLVATNTLPKLLKFDYERYREGRIALRQKDFGIWQSYTWKDYYENVKYFALALMSLGFQNGDKATIIGDNDVHWIFAELGTMAAGGIAVGAYQDALPTEIKYVIEQSDSSFVIADNQEQVDKLLQIAEELPQLKKIIYWDPKGLRTYNVPSLMFYDDVIELGKEYERSHPRLFEDKIENQDENDIAFFCYTSGTTGVPKASMLSHRNLIVPMRGQNAIVPGFENDVYFSVNPLAWILDLPMFVIRALLTGAIVSFPESPETTPENLREIGPRIAWMAPRLLEAMTREVQVKVRDSTALKRAIYNLFLPIGYHIVDLKVRGERINIFWRMLSNLAYWVLFRPVRDRLGFRRTEWLFTGGASLGTDFARFFRALGIALRSGYGAAEMGASWTLQFPGEEDVEGAGRPSLDMEIRIGSNGEILVRAPGVMKGYYKNPKATEEKIIDCWIHSGDAGFFTEDGKLIIIDRVADLMTLKSGGRFSPTYIENKLKFCPYIKDAVILGDGESYVAAMISVDYGLTGKSLEAQGVPYTTYTDLSQKPEVYELISDYIIQINRRLPPDHRIKRMALMHKELDADDAELTRTRKLRRGYVGKFYDGFIESIYSGSCEYTAEAEVRYRGVGGRSTKIMTTVKIVDLEEKQ